MVHATTRRGFLFGGAAIAAAGALAACGGGSGSGSGGARLRMAGWGSPEQNKALFAALKTFEGRNKGTRVIPEFTDFAAYTEKIVTQVAGGNPPDAVQMTNLDLMPRFADSSSIIDLSRFVPKTIDLSGYPEGALVGGRIDGKQYGLPQGALAWAVLYNRDAFDDAGVSVPGDEWTWEEFARVTRELARKSGDGFAGTEDASGNYNVFEMWLRPSGKSVVTEDGTPGYDRDDLTAYWEFWADLRTSGACSPADVQAASKPEDAATSGLVTGKAAMFFTNSGNLLAAQGLTKTKLDLHTLPNGFEDKTGNFHFVTGRTWGGVSAKAADPQAVAELYQFLLNDEAAAPDYYDASRPPLTKEARKAIRGDQDATGKAVLDYFDRVEVDAAAPPAVPSRVYPEIQATVIRLAQEVAFGKTSVRKGVDEVFATIDEAVAK